MLFGLFVIGGLAGWILTGNYFGALAGAVVGASVALVAERALRTSRSPRAMAAEPIDLSVPTPPRLTPSRYQAMPLASRNGVVARLVASASREDPETVAALLPYLMGRKSAPTEQAEQERRLIMSANWTISPEDSEAIYAACQGELRLAAKASLPQTDRAREFATRTMGEPVSEGAMRRAALKARLGTGQSLADLIDDAVAGRVDLAFAVGTIRRVGALQAREFAKMR